MSRTDRTQAALRALDALLAEDPGARGIASFRPHDALGPAARALAGAPSEAGRVAITTGFPRGDVGETDGPPGAIALGHALGALGARVVHFTDSRNAPLLLALGADPLETVDLAVGDREGAAALLARLDATHLVAIERPGRAADRTFRNMRGVDITARTSALDEVFLLAQEPATRRTTVCVGDGGNEVGMGSVRARVAATVAHGDVIATIVPCDHLVVAGVSNWGAYGLCAALSLFAGRDLLPTPEDARAHVEKIVAAGSVDGVTGRAEVTVDGLPIERTLDLLEAMRRILRAAS